MDRPNLIIFKFKNLYQIIKELEENLNFAIIEASNEKILDEMKSISKNYLVITQKNIDGLDLQVILNKLPIKISKLLEIINIQLIKSQYNQKSQLYVGKYILNLNSKLLVGRNSKLKLTEKEANIIIFLHNSKVPISVDQLQSEVWAYNSSLETHTVETHVYRLRKKVLEKFNDNNFIQSTKNGYQIK